MCFVKGRKRGVSVGTQGAVCPGDRAVSTKPEKLVLAQVRRGKGPAGWEKGGGVGKMGQGR